MRSRARPPPRAGDGRNAKSHARTAAHSETAAMEMAGYAPPRALEIGEVFSTLQAAMNTHDASSRRAAVETLGRWERSAAAGFSGALAAIASQPGVGEEVVLLATIAVTG